MQQHTEKQITKNMNSFEESMYLERKAAITEIEAQVSSSQLGLEQGQQKVKILKSIAPSQYERDMDRTGETHNFDKRLRKAADSVSMYQTMLQTYTEQLRDAREALEHLTTRVNVRLNEELQIKAERKLQAEAMVEAMKKAGLVVKS